MGVELQKPKGDTDGTYQGIRLFTCAPNYGVFVKAASVRVVFLCVDSFLRVLSVLRRWLHSRPSAPFVAPVL